jgi:Holliday junction resolvasome RuvABC endonuclease subunit
MSNRVYLGFDQALAKSGWAILEFDKSKNKLIYVASGVFNPETIWGRKSDAIIFLEHLHHIKTLLTEVSKSGELQAIGVEGVAFSAPGQAASRGGIFALYSTMSLPYADVVIIAPTRLKKYLTDFGFAEKEDIKKVIEPRYKVSGLKPDEYDAIGLAEVTAFAHMIMNGEEELVKKLLTPEQFLLFKEQKKAPKKSSTKLRGIKKKTKRQIEKSEQLHGICDRPDDFYITKRDK